MQIEKERKKNERVREKELCHDHGREGEYNYYVSEMTTEREKEGKRIIFLEY